ncbi:uncharacterized protein LOC120413630 isoform X4 [Culex pipiens pallens]|uniref:uncharacterized protein LOC120413630 isoform X4 n=1 Tax=Culex pipiens pallens TaxID=42434 RepID=UPI001954EECD|nr:uncharacterized protein LOC120413630 isoform X4 [Culex pipiens pallens]
MSDRKSHGFDGFEFSGVGGGAASGSFFGANASSTLRRMLSAVEPFTNTDKTVAMTSFGGGENVLQNFTLQTNFHRQGQQRAKRKRKESSFSSCSSSSSASTLLSLVAQGPPTSAERRFPPPPTTSAAGVGEENSFGVGGGGSSVEEQSGQQKNGKSLLGGKTADLNESTSVAGVGGGVDYYNRSSEPPAQDVGEDEQTDSPRRKRPKYDYTRDQMFEIFQPWVIQTYGDRAKTKTITLKKQARIIKTLKGQEMNNPDSSKFRFWVKTKGFTTNKPKGFQDIFVFHNQEENDGCLLFAPNTTETDTQPYKKVAVVENFFNIIYGVHVSLGSRSTRHAGQKRTYRTITETYAFLPREAVTKFLSLCGQCSKAMRPNSPIKLEDPAPTAPSSPVCSVTEESFDDGAAVLPSSLARDTRGNSVVSSSFDSLASDEVYAKLMDCYKVQGGQGGDRAGGNSSTYYQLLKTFYDNVKKREECSAVESSRRDEGKSETVEEDEEMVVDLTGTPDSDKPSGRNSSKVPKTVAPQDEESSKSRSRRSLAKAAVEVDADADDEEDDDGENGEVLSVGDGARPELLSSKELFASCEPSSEVSEKIRLNNNLDDKFDDSDGDSDASGQSRSESVPITSTYLELTRSMGVTDDDALNMESIAMPFNNELTENNGTGGAAAGEDAYAGLIKDADKFKLMLLAWNYQNSAAGKSAQNGAEGPDLATMTNLWQQYQNALAMNAKTSFNQLPIPERQQPSPIEQHDETNSSEQKDDDDLSEDDSEDRIEATVNDPERLKAFNMFVRLFVDENLDRIIPISKQPKEKIQAIIDSCTRQFPEFAERARKRIRTYLKSCRRNKKTREGWENTSRPTPAHLTSVQAEQILAVACENESLNAKRMRIGLEPISQSVTPTTAVSYMTSEPPNVPTLYQNMNLKCETETTPPVKTEPLTSVPKLSPVQNTTPDINQMKLNIPSASASSTPTIPTTVPTISNFSDYNTGFTNRSQHYTNFMNSVNSSNSTSTTMSATGTAPTDLSMKRPILAHKLNSAEITAVKQLVTGYRESAAFLMRSADELENLLLQQQ